MNDFHFHCIEMYFSWYLMMKEKHQPNCYYLYHCFMLGQYDKFKEMFLRYLQLTVEID